MPIQPMQFQPLSFEQANPLIAGAQAGSSLYKSFADTLATELANRKAKAIMPEEIKQAIYTSQIMAPKAKLAPQMAQADLEQAQALPGKTRAETNQANAMSGYLGQQTKWYGDKAKAEIALQKAEAGLYGTNAEQKALMLRFLQQKMGGQAPQQDQNGMSTPSADSSFNGQGSAAPQGMASASQPQQQGQQAQGQSSAPSKNSYYGVETPEPSVDDIANKMFFGLDTFSPKIENAKAQQQGQYTAYQKEVEDANRQAQEATDMSRLLSQYNYWMDNSTLSGAFGGRAPALGTASQSVDNLVNQISLSGIEKVRAAMGSAKFAVADLNVALGMKPSRTWTKGTRQFYTDFTNAVNQRLQERAQFYTMLGNNPRSDLPKQDADALWTAYQNKYPISNKAGNKVLQGNLNHWQDFVSPRAIQSVKQTGTYSPISKSDVTEKNIQDTMKATGMSRKEVMAELEKEGLS